MALTSEIPMEGKMQASSIPCPAGRARVGLSDSPKRYGGELLVSGSTRTLLELKIRGGEISVTC